MRCCLWILFLLLPLTLPARVWKELDGVSYVENTSNDGDSFHAKRNSSNYLFRLYFVDTPETDERYPDRIKAQADYFGLTPAQTLQGGDAAAAYVRKLLAEEGFTVYTRYADAKGSSRQKRYFAMVKVGDRWLSELLVEQGYARIYGRGTQLPDDTETEKYWARLRKLEREAQKEKRGLWGLAAGKNL